MPSTPFTTGHYFYMSDLLALAACVNPSPPPLTHSNSMYILDGIASGFRFGFTYTAITCISATSNANEHPDIISNALHQEVVKGRLVGPLIPKRYPYIQISSLGAVPKKNSVDKWHLILDLFRLMAKGLASMTVLTAGFAPSHI